jgi:hypothetical protein
MRDCYHESKLAHHPDVKISLYFRAIAQKSALIYVSNSSFLRGAASCGGNEEDAQTQLLSGPVAN